jgi:hypothetical protein
MKKTYKVEFEFMKDNMSHFQIIFVYGNYDILSDMKKILLKYAEMQKIFNVKKIIEMPELWNDEDDINIENLDSWFIDMLNIKE